MKRSQIGIVFFLLASTFGVFMLYFILQPVLTYSGCKLCDGHQYLAIYNYFRGNLSTYQVIFPCYSRIFVPGIASLLPWNEALLNFQVINLIFSILSVLTIYYLWKKLQIPAYLIFIGLFWLLFHWTGIIRLNAFDPFTVDVPIYFLQTIFIWIFLTRKFRWLWLLGPVSVLQKESIIVLLIMLLVFSYLQNKMQEDEKNYPVITILIALFLTIIVKYIFTLKFPSMDADKSSVKVVFFYIKEILIDPLKIVRWLVSIFMAYGAFLILVFQKLQKKDFSTPCMTFFVIMSLTYLLLGIIGGYDNTRIVFLGFPFVMTWILLILKEVPWKLSLIALIFSVPTMRLLTPIPDPGINFPAFAVWYPEYAQIDVVAGWGVYYMFCFLLLFQMNKFLNFK